MADTSYSIELKGLDLPADARERVDSALENAVMTELAKLDLSDQVKVEPLSTERMIIPSGLMGFVVRNILKKTPTPTVERSVDSGRQPVFPIAFGTDQLPLPITDMEALEALCLRPDVREAIISNSRAFVELLSQDELASKNFNELLSKLNGGQGDRFAPLVIVAVCVGSAAVGAAVGYFSRK